MTSADSSNRMKELLERTAAAAREKGIIHVLRSLVKESKFLAEGYVAVFYHRTFRSRAEFSLNGRNYSYFYHRYGRTWKNERIVEIPVIWEIVRKYVEKQVLEIGNVLPNYFAFSHDIVDKYEKSKGVINSDVVDFHPPKKYDLIVSISTLEHVGWDENPKEPDKVLRAVANLRSLLAPGGRIVFTAPVGQNPYLDRYLSENMIKLTERFYLKRVSASNEWVEIDRKEAQTVKYNQPFSRANAIVVGIIEDHEPS